MRCPVASLVPRRRCQAAIFQITTLLLLAAKAAGHAYLKLPKPRNADTLHTAEFTGERINPFRQALVLANTGCGGGSKDTAGPVAVEVDAGDLLSLEWVVSVPHHADRRYPGVRISLSFSDTDSFNQNILAEGVDAGGNYPGEKVSFTVLIPPGKTCDACVLQWMWAGRNDNAAYINCVDIKIKAPPATCSTAACQVEDPSFLLAAAVQQRWTSVCTNSQQPSSGKCLKDFASACDATGVPAANLVRRSCTEYVEHVRRHAYGVAPTSLVRPLSATSPAAQGCNSVCVYGVPSATVDTCSADFVNSLGSGSGERAGVAVAVQSGAALGDSGCPLLCPLPKSKALDEGLFEVEELCWECKDRFSEVNASLIFFQSLLDKPAELEPFLQRARKFLSSFNQKARLFTLLPKIGAIAAAIVAVVDALLTVIDGASAVLAGVVSVADGLDDVADLLRGMVGTAQVALDRLKGGAQILRETIGPARRCIESGHPLLCNALSSPAEGFSAAADDNVVHPVAQALRTANATLADVVRVLGQGETAVRRWKVAADAASEVLLAGKSVDEFVKEWSGKLDDVDKVLEDTMCVPYEVSKGKLSCSRRRDRNLLSWGNKKSYKLSTPPFLVAIGVPSCTAEVKTVELCFSVKEVLEAADLIAAPVRARFEEWANKAWSGLGLPFDANLAIDVILGATGKGDALRLMREALEKISDPATNALAAEPTIKAAVDVAQGVGRCAAQQQAKALVVSSSSSSSSSVESTTASSISTTASALGMNPLAGLDFKNPFKLNPEQLELVAGSLLRRLNFTRELESVCVLTVNQIGNALQEVDEAASGAGAGVDAAAVAEFAAAAVESEGGDGGQRSGEFVLSAAQQLTSSTQLQAEYAVASAVSSTALSAETNPLLQYEQQQTAAATACESGLMDPRTGACVKCGTCDPSGKWCLQCGGGGGGLSSGAIAAIVLCVLFVVAVATVALFRRRVMQQGGGLGSLHLPWGGGGGGGRGPLSSSSGKRMKRVDTTSWLQAKSKNTDTI